LPRAQDRSDPSWFAFPLTIRKGAPFKRSDIVDYLEENLIQTLDFLQNSGLKVISCTEKTKTSIYTCDLTVPLAIILGSEEDGISDELIRKSDELAAIPQSGQVGSLNVSVATGVVIFEATRQRV
jgi:23S rRNA (guanosine2251-2'-O)-methyltransferase